MCVVDGTRRGTSAGREGGWYHRTAGRPTRAARFRTRQTDTRGRHHRWSRGRRAVGRRHPLFVTIEPDARLAGRPRLGDGRRRHRRPADRGRSARARRRSSHRRSALLGLAGICYVVGLQLDVRRVADRQGLDRRADRGHRRRGRRAHRGRPRRHDRRRRRADARRHRDRRHPVHPGTRPGGCARRRFRLRGRRARRPRRRDDGSRPRHQRRTSTRSTPDEPRCCRSSRRSSSDSVSWLPASRRRSCRSPGSR